MSDQHQAELLVPKLKKNWKKFDLKTQDRIKNNRITNISNIEEKRTNLTKIIQSELEY